MRRLPAAVILLAVTSLFGAALGGCGSADDERAAAAVRDEWPALQREKRELDSERQQLARLRGRLAAAPVTADGTPASAEDQTLAADVETRERRVTTRSAALGERLVRYTATFAWRQDEPPPAALQAAIRLKSDEDLEVAQEWIDRGGDYRRAIEILETQLHADPGYARLDEALARARQMRYVTPQRFARVQAGMTQIDVRAALGPVNLRQVLRRPAERLQAWYYPKAGGGRAAVYFRYDPEKRSFLVYGSELAAGEGRPAPAAPVAAECHRHP